MTEVQVSGVSDFAELGARWRELERCSAGSFFQSWSWVGCLASERFPDPVLVEALDQGRTVALGLFNRVRHWGRLPALYLTESGTAELDSPYVEQNGFLSEAGREDELAALCLQPLARQHDVFLSGVGQQMLTAARRATGAVVTRRSQPSVFADLAAVRYAGGDFLAGRSANTRQQLRRSDRFYEREGAIRLQAAGSVAGAHAMLASLAELHQAIWRARGKPGSFSTPFFGRFHHALIDRGWPLGEVALLAVSSGATIIGYLYNFAWRRRMLAYQSGFAYRDHASPAKPGLTCHHAAIRFALNQEFDTYDFLAGDDRYKRSLGDGSLEQFWLEAGPRWSPRQLLRRCRLIRN